MPVLRGLLFLVGASAILLISRPVLQAAADAFDSLKFGLLAGTFISVLILLVVPVILLGVTSPFAIKLSIRQAQGIGRISGQIYAISTLGSFIGTFLPILILLPYVGVYRSFLVVSGLLMGVALFGLWRAVSLRAALVYLWAPFLLLVILFFGLPGSDRLTSGMIYEGESSYNYIQVVEKNDLRVLRLNEGQGQHSVYHPTRLIYNGPWEMVLAAPFFNAAAEPGDVNSLAIVGLAAGTTARQATLVFGSIPIDGWEIDPLIIEVGQKYFDMNMPNLQAYAQDGRWGLAHSTEKYTIIGIDAYRPPYIPPHLTTVEFFQIVKDRLTEDGVAVVNVGRSPSDRSLIGALANTLDEVFPSVFVVDVPESFNSIIYATKRPASWSNLVANFDRLSQEENVHPLLIEVLQRAILLRQEVPESKLVFTDDRAPIEWITNTMVLSYVFLTDMEEVK